MEKIFKKKADPGFDTIVFPIVRQVFARTIALDLVTVQPMSLPKGMLFYMDGFPEREDVFTRIVIFEKYKPYVYKSTWDTQTYNNNGRYYSVGIDPCLPI